MFGPWSFSKDVGKWGLFGPRASVFTFSPKGGHSNVNRGIRHVQKFTYKGSFFHNRALYVPNMSMVSNSGKIGSKGMFFGDLTYLGLFFMQNLCRRV